MIAKEHIVPVFIAAMLVVCVATAARTSTADAEAISTQATMLTEQAGSSSERILKLHQFVRDEIRETKTTYG